VEQLEEVQRINSIELVEEGQLGALDVGVGT
jgi:hypothetical protein